MNKSIFFSILLIMVVITGCGGIPQTHYYRIDYTPASATSNNAGVPVTLGVSQFTADVLYESDKIVYRNSPYEVQFYHYRRWVAPPRKIVTERILRQYQTSGAFGKVVRLPTKQTVDYVLKGNIRAFEEWDENNAWAGLVTLEFSLQDIESNETIWQKTLSQRTAAVKREPVEVVKAISQSLNQVIQNSIEDIEKHLVNRTN